MVTVKIIIDILFSIGLFVSAVLMIPQIIKIFITKNTDDFSLLSYVGFNLFQLAMVLHGAMQKDYVLMFGFLLCFILNAIVVIMIMYYRKMKSPVNLKHLD